MGKYDFQKRTEFPTLGQEDVGSIVEVKDKLYVWDGENWLEVKAYNDRWTIEEWNENLILNSKDAYSLACVFAAVCIRQYGEEEGLAQVSGLSGAQATFAKAIEEKMPLFEFEEGKLSSDARKKSKR